MVSGFIRFFIIGCIIAGVWACELTPEHSRSKEINRHIDQSILTHTIDEKLDETNQFYLPEFISEELMPQIEENTPHLALLLSEKHFEISADKVNVQQFFASLVKDTSYSVVTHPDVSGTITMQLSEVTLDDVLNVVSDIYGYEN